MARANLDIWIPVEKGSDVLIAVQNSSAAEALLRPEPMSTDTKTIPASGDVDVTVTPKGAAYTEGTTTDREVTLKTRKFTGLLRIADEDLSDIPRDIIAAKQAAWANTYARRIDFATFSNTATEDGLASPFTSIYKTLATTNSGLGYTANANIVKTTAGAAITYDNMASVLGKMEMGDYFDSLAVAAHPYFKGAMRTMKDGQNRPLFVEGQGDVGDSFFGYPVRWSAGLKTGTDVRVGPAGTGSPLLAVFNRGFNILGKRSGPEFAVVNGFTGASALTDEALIKARTRRAFVCAHPMSAAILEAVPAV